MTKLIYRVVVWLMVFAGAAALVYLSMRPQPVLIDTVVATSGQLVVTVDEDGVTRIRERYIVSTPLSGRLERVTLEVGDQVLAGETILANMQPTDPSLLDPRAVAQAKARVSAAERRLQAAAAELTKAESEVQYAETEMGRTRQLWEQKAASINEFESKQLAFRGRTEDARAAGFAVDIARYELELEKAALLLTDPTSKADESRHANLSIKSPIDGRVLRVYQESSAVLAAGESIIELGDPLDLEVVTDVLSYDAVRIRRGASVKLLNWGQDQVLLGEVRIVEPSGFTKLSALGVEEQRVNVIIDLKDSPEKRHSLGDGFRVDSQIVVWESANALKLPTSAFFRQSGDWHTFVVRANKAVLTKVELGVNNGIEAQVLEGVRENEVVIVHPSDKIHDGQIVQDRSDSAQR